MRENNEESKEKSFILKKKILSRKTPITIPRTKKQKTKNIESRELNKGI
jgi:hypothetical protein